VDLSFKVSFKKKAGGATTRDVQMPPIKVGGVF
jgi:hypothetical protein